MPNKSRNKGRGFEYEVADFIHLELGVTVKRDLEQYRQQDRGDLLGLPGWTIECKRRATGSVFPDPKWWEQVSKAAKAAGTAPALFYRYDRQPMAVATHMAVLNPELNYEWATPVILQPEAWATLVREGFPRTSMWTTFDLRTR